MSALRRCVLVVEDEALIAEVWCIHMKMMGVDVCGVAANADAAVSLAQEHQPAVVLMDVRLKGPGDGVDAAISIHEHVRSQIIFITGSREPEMIERIGLGNPAAILFKPVSDRQLRAAMDDALKSVFG